MSEEERQELLRKIGEYEKMIENAEDALDEAILMLETALAEEYELQSI